MQDTIEDSIPFSYDCIKHIANIDNDYSNDYPNESNKIGLNNDIIQESLQISTSCNTKDFFDCDDNVEMEYDQTENSKIYNCKESSSQSQVTVTEPEHTTNQIIYSDNNPNPSNPFNLIKNTQISSKNNEDLTLVDHLHRKTWDDSLRKKIKTKFCEAIRTLLNFSCNLKKRNQFKKLNQIYIKTVNITLNKVINRLTIRELYCLNFWEAPNPEDDEEEKEKKKNKKRKELNKLKNHMNLLTSVVNTLGVLDLTVAEAFDLYLTSKYFDYDIKLIAMKDGWELAELARKIANESYIDYFENANANNTTEEKIGFYFSN